MLSLGVSASLILQPYLVTRFCQLLLITCHEAWFDVAVEHNERRPDLGEKYRS